ncbi:pimeloyl-ACP methyl ester carboxylesterase [Microterricola gilva]|uniref:Pimeloyl-ACP methyl ester carboxylesterase n=1 Tax=Microterricola gilva TaxID=393267 RepID=A0A4Q8APC4_9MICO|nr:alpha/beta fold hydrolase [Microterricola gilva]RZU66477.1 pimeloyl-ACP methyl ester carboxylesterase [Microterricola gilva]
MATDLFVREYGRPARDAPAILILHGAVESGACYANAVARWGDDYCIVAPDARGHGDSPSRLPEHDNVPSTDVMVQDAIDILEDLLASSGRKTIIVGHSMGARIAAFVAADAPHLIAGVVLEDPPWWVPEDGPNPWLSVEQTTPDPFDFRDTATVDELVEMQRAQNPHWAESELRPLAEAMKAVDTDFMERRLHEKRRIWTPTARQITVGPAGVPALLITGSGDVIVDKHSRERLMAVAPGFDIVVIEGAHHCIRRDKPDEYHRHVDAFLRENAPAVGTVTPR